MDFEVLPEELVAPERVRALAILVQRTMEEPETISDIAWSDELRVSWKERLARMLRALQMAYRQS